MIIMFLMIFLMVIAAVTTCLWTAYFMALIESNKKIELDKGVMPK